ncbi:TetR/AcrR family transcriptional regulator [Latilactobacillus sakei]|uniref:TetR/AcrR family transcriptional regulator n=1 Tax=Latilactobacillus sakei TaxID=1599 RepID=UPI00388AAEA4
MYQGKNPAALTSQKLLLDSLNELLQAKSFKDISISELCNHSGISRQTFYSLFGSKENILLYQLQHAPYVRQPEDVHTANLSLYEICERFSGFIVSNYDQLQMLINNELIDLLNKLIYQAMSSCQESFINLINDERRYAASFMSAGLCNLTQEYIAQHDQPDQKGLTQISFKIMSGSIYRH